MPFGAPYLNTANVLGKVHFTRHPPKSPKPSHTHMKRIGCKKKHKLWSQLPTYIKDRLLLLIFLGCLRALWVSSPFYSLILLGLFLGLTLLVILFCNKAFCFFLKWKFVISKKNCIVFNPHWTWVEFWNYDIEHCFLWKSNSFFWGHNPHYIGAFRN
jgi:hypothetical protein